jgi:hypothetical protein
MLGGGIRSLLLVARLSICVAILVLSQTDGFNFCRTGKGKFAPKAITLDDYLPMRSMEVKNR